MTPDTRFHASRITFLVFSFPVFTTMTRKRILAVLLLFLLLPPAVIGAVATRQGATPSCGRWVAPGYAWAAVPARWLARQIQSAFAAPGMVVAVAARGQIVWSEGFGYADLARQTPACPSTSFRIGSLSKPLTAAAMAQLYEQGRLDLDAPIQRYVPGFPDKGTPITTRQLAAHLAGIRHNDTMEDIANQKHYASVGESLKIFANDPLLFPPGTRFAYSSYGYNLIGAVIEGAAGEDYPSYMKRHIFEPLGMSRTGPDDPDVEDPYRATFYEDLPGGLEVAPYADLSHKLPSGGLLSTPEDLVRFASALAGGRLLKAKTVEMLFTPACPECPGEREGQGYGLGWEIDRDPLGHRLAGHTGATVGSSAGLLLYPGEQVALALAMNVGSVTNPDPTLHGFPPDPQWIAQFFILAHRLVVYRFDVALAVLLAILLGLLLILRILWKRAEK